MNIHAHTANLHTLMNIHTSHADQTFRNMQCLNECITPMALEQECGISSALALEIPQSYTEQLF